MHSGLHLKPDKKDKTKVNCDSVLLNDYGESKRQDLYPTDMEKDSSIKAIAQKQQTEYGEYRRQADMEKDCSIGITTQKQQTT